jgi:uncharacterized protein (DUF3084 family)
VSDQAEKLAALLKIQEVTVAGLLIAILLLTALAIARGWLVVGSQHRETIAARDACRAELATCRERREQVEARVGETRADLARHEERESLGWPHGERETPR